MPSLYRATCHKPVAFSHRKFSNKAKWSQKTFQSRWKAKKESSPCFPLAWKLEYVRLPSNGSSLAINLPKGKTLDNSRALKSYSPLLISIDFVPSKLRANNHCFARVSRKEHSFAADWSSFSFPITGTCAGNFVFVVKYEARTSTGGNRVPVSCQPSLTRTTTSSSCVPVMQSSRISGVWKRGRCSAAPAGNKTRRVDRRPRLHYSPL